MTPRRGAEDKPSTEPAATEPDEWDTSPDPGFPGITGAEVEQAVEPSPAKLRVEATTHVTLENEVINPGQKLEVNDTAEARNCIAVGFLRLLDDDEELDPE